MAPKTVEGGQIWLKCITGDLIMMIRDKNNIFVKGREFSCRFGMELPISGVKCQKAELVDLSERPDVERYEWDGADIDFETPIQ